MSHELNLAITLPVDPLLVAAPVALIVVLLLLGKVRSKRRANKGKATGLAMASIELGIDLDPVGSDRGPIAQGKVNNHVVSIATLSGKGRKNHAETQYAVRYEAPEAPKFSLAKRVDASVPTLDTGNPKFDAVVAIHTEQPSLLTRFLTAERRTAILRLIASWPTAQITNRETHLTTSGIETDADALVDAACHLVAAAETFDRPSARPQPMSPSAISQTQSTVTHAPAATPVEATDAPTNLEPALFEEAAIPEAPITAEPATALDEIPSAAPAVALTEHVMPQTEIVVDESSEMDELVAAAQAIYAAGTESLTETELTPPDAAVEAGAPADTEPVAIDQTAPASSELAPQAELVMHGDVDGDILTEIRLDEATVLNDLFNSGLDEAGTSARFEQVYQGREVSWTGEVLRLGPTDRGRQRIAAFVGSADGQDPSSGRVVALTAVDPEPVLAPGDIVSFNGTLVNLDTAQRLFHVV